MPLNIKTIDNHSHQRKKTQILCNDAEGHRKQREDLPPEKKIKILQTDADAHNKKRESLSPEDKELFDKNHSAAQNKYCKFLTLDQKAQELQKMLPNTLNNTSCFPQRKKQDSWKPRLNNVMII